MDVTIRGDREVKIALNSLADLKGVDLDFDIQPLPAPPRPAAGEFAALASPAQIRAFWAANPNGYSRTNVHSNPFPYQIKPFGAGIVYEIIYPKPYSKYVVGVNSQARIHAGRWWTVRDMVGANMGKIVKHIQDAIKRKVGL